MGNMSKVVKQLSKERARLTDELHRVTAALTAFGKVYLSGSNPKAVGNTKRTLSAAGRRRISQAQKKRWATARKESMPQVPAKRTMSASARKKIALAQRKRWAQVRAQAKKGGVALADSGRK
jgi:16S rRNA G1207 methylase RsmC